MEMSTNATSENNMTMDNLPDNVIPLGNSQFLVVRSFQGQTRIHIRKFFEDNGQLHPTKDGVSLALRVWVALTEKLPKLLSKRYFDRYPNDHIEVLERDLCVVKSMITNPVERIEIMLQRMFQRRDGSFQFVPEAVHLNEEQCYLLVRSTQRVKDLIEISLITATLQHHVVKLVSEQASTEARAYMARPHSNGLAETRDSLCKCFLEFITLKIKEIALCYGCFDNVDQTCTCYTPKELLNMYFETALYVLNYAELAQKFVGENMHHMYFAKLILTGNFLTDFNVSSFLNHVKNMFAPTDEMLCDMMEIC
jgi:hypothetical protein